MKRAAAYLGIECGGTKTAALLAQGGRVTRGSFGSANLRLMSDGEFRAHLAGVKKTLCGKTRLDGVAICMAGARTERDRGRIRAAAAVVWPGVRCHATDDLEPALLAAGPMTRARVLIVSGTGSCCVGRTMDGRTVRVGGWGHILGDQGSGYQIGLNGVRSALHVFDRDGKWPEFGKRLLRVLQLNEPNDLIDWARKASKAEVAALAKEVFAARGRGEKTTKLLPFFARWELKNLAIKCARRIVTKRQEVEFILAGSILLKQPSFARRLGTELREEFKRARILPLPREAVWGALELARGNVNERRTTAVVEARAEFVLPTSGLSPTEERNPRSMNLDRLPAEKAVGLMIDEEARVAAALRKIRPEIARAVGMVTAAFRGKGRLFYIGAGTSGRLGVLDASECPPTFRVSPEQVQGIIAGGQTALWQAVEGAEDDMAAGAAAVAHRGVRRGDVVMGIAASGRTPFVWGALGEAKRRGAKTILLCFNPRLSIPKAMRPDLALMADVGPEILTGSTRLKCGTATKIVLNTITTLAMARLGKVSGNLMVDLNPSNEKLRDRATRMVQELTGAGTEAARAALEKSGWVVKEALRRLR